MGELPEKLGAYIQGNAEDDLWTLEDENGSEIIACDLTKENAETLKHRYNTHPDLLAACKVGLKKLSGTNIMGELCNPKEVEMLTQAIAKAEGKE